MPRKLSPRLSSLGRLWLVLALASLLPVMSRPALGQEITINRGAILEEALRNGRAGNHVAARQGVRYLLRSSPNDKDAAFLLGLYSQLRRDNPWHLQGWLSANPSTNVTGVSSKSSFTTSLGEFTIADGGKPVAGTSYAGQVELGRGFVLGPGREVLALLRLQRQANPAAHLSRNEAYLEARFEALSRKGSLSVTPSIGFIAFDEAQKGETKPDRRILSLTIAREWFVSPVSSAFTRVRLSRADYVYQPHNSATSAEATLGYSAMLDARTSYNLSATLGRSATSAAHTTATTLALQGEINRSVLTTGNLGLGLMLSGASFDGPVPLLNTRRQDGTVAVTVSYGDDRIKLFGQTPELTCTYRRTNSNVALYATQSSDCQIGLAMRF